ncbi:MAG: DUF4384 domain-containing protein [Pseudomonadota bacterium]
MRSLLQLINSPRRRLRAGLLRGAVVMAAATALLTTPMPAEAQNTLQVSQVAASQSGTSNLPGTPLRDAFVGAFNELISPLLDGQCFDMKFTGRVPVAFVGIPRNTIHLSDLQRDNLNQVARKALNNPFLNVQDTNALATIASYSGNNELDRQRLRDAVAKVRGAPLVLVISAERPARKLARLQLQLFTTRANGARACPKSATLLVDLERLVAIPRTLAERYEPYDSGFVEQRYAFREAIRRIARELSDYTDVSMLARLNLSGSCALSQQALARLQGVYSSVGDTLANSFSLDAGDWPRLTRAEQVIGTRKPRAANDADAGADPSAKPAKLEVEIALNAAYPGSYFVTMRLIAARGIRKVINFGVIAGRRELRGCRPRAVDFLSRVVEDARAAPASFTITPIQPEFQVGVDEVDFRIRPSTDGYYYCWIMDQEGTAYVLYPWRAEMQNEPWKAGATVHYPGDFVRGSGKSQFDELPGRTIYGQVATELFGCFAAKQRPPSDVEADWIRLHPANSGGSGTAKSLTREEVGDLMERWRALDGVEESYAYVRAVP